MLQTVQVGESIGFSESQNGLSKPKFIQFNGWSSLEQYLGCNKHIILFLFQAITKLHVFLN